MATVEFESACELNCCGCNPQVAVVLRDTALTTDGSGVVLGTLTNWCDGPTPGSPTNVYSIFINDALLTDPGALLPGDISDIGCFDAGDQYLDTHKSTGAATQIQYVEVAVAPTANVVLLTPALIAGALGGTLDIGSTVIPVNFIYATVESSIPWNPAAMTGPNSEELGLNQWYVAMAGDPNGAAPGDVVQVLRGSPDPGSTQFSIHFHFPPIPV